MRDHKAPDDKLLRWIPAPACGEHAHDDDGPTAAVPPPGAILVNFTADVPTGDQHALHRAASLNGVAERLFEPDSEMAGRPWYDSLPRIRSMRTVCRHKDGEHILHTNRRRDHRPPFERAESIVVQATVEQPDGGTTTLPLPTDVVVPAPSANWPDEQVAVTAGADIAPEQLADFLAEACHRCRPADEDDDEWKRTQHTRFLDAAYQRACEILQPPDVALTNALTHAALRHLVDLVPRNRAVDLVFRPGRPPAVRLDP